MKRLTCIALLIISASSLFAQNSMLPENEIDDIIETNFLLGEIPKRYYSNILIELRGNPTKDDSIIVQGLVDTLNPLIETWDIYLVSEGKANNLILDINPDSTDTNIPISNSYKDRKYEIISRRKEVKELTPELKFKEREKIIRYNLIRTLLQSNSSYKLKERIPGSVFSVPVADSITFSPVDFQIIQAAYSQKYDNIYKEVLNENPSARDITGSKKKSNLKKNPFSPYFRKHWNIILMAVNLLSVLISIWLLTFFFHRGFFKKHHYNFIAFIKQGIIVFGILFISYVIYIVAIIFKISAVYINIKETLLPVIAFSLFLFIIGFISLLIIYFSERRILKNNDNLMLSVLFPLVTTMVIPSFLILIIFLVLSKPNDSKTPSDVATIFITSISILSFFSVLRAFFIFLSKKSESIIHQKDVELARISELHKQAELQSLRSKINPHFLYNSLNSIASLALIDAKRTEQMALSLSDFFRYSINREQKQTNQIAEELEAIKTYLEIEKVRFGDRLNFKITCPENMLYQQIPQLLIQPLVENAVKHGISKSIENGTIKITVSEKDRKLHIRVADTGPNFPDGPLSGFGIRNTNERLHLLYGKKASINWENGAEKYIEITFPA